MPNRSCGRVALFSLLAIALIVSACHKKTPVGQMPTPVQPTQPAARPTVTLQASPTFIQKGQSSTLTWNSTNATTLSISGVGSVAPEGSTQVSPNESTAFTITATGPGGEAEQSVRITVGEPAVAQPEEAPTPSMEAEFDKDVHDAYFDTDRSDIRPDARDALARTGQFLRTYPEAKVVVEGDCDERGSTEYNLGLGQRRADAAKQILESLGVSADRMQTVSYGKEKPVCTEHSEECWQRNRRAHFVLSH